MPATNRQASVCRYVVMLGAAKIRLLSKISKSYIMFLNMFCINRKILQDKG